MNPLNTLLDAARRLVRAFMGRLAKGLNTLSEGRLHPNAVTLVGLFAHVPIAWLIATSRNNLAAAILLIIFGLFDTLDGELARLQKRASNAGMLLDATTDRVKEVILYMGAAVALADHSVICTSGPEGYCAPFALGFYAMLPVAACGGSLLVSYVKAKGETVVAGNLPANEVNRLFQDGLARFEVRMAILVCGLLVNGLWEALAIIAVLSWLTSFSRLVKISKKLR